MVGLELDAEPQLVQNREANAETGRVWHEEVQVLVALGLREPDAARVI
jgi:hypothetical protein